MAVCAPWGKVHHFILLKPPCYWRLRSFSRHWLLHKNAFSCHPDVSRFLGLEEETKTFNGRGLFVFGDTLTSSRGFRSGVLLSHAVV